MSPRRDKFCWKCSKSNDLQFFIVIWAIFNAFLQIFYLTYLVALFVIKVSQLGQPWLVKVDSAVQYEILEHIIKFNSYFRHFNLKKKINYSCFMNKRED